MRLHAYANAALISKTHGAPYDFLQLIQILIYPIHQQQSKLFYANFEETVKVSHAPSPPCYLAFCCNLASVTSNRSHSYEYFRIHISTCYVSFIWMRLVATWLPLPPLCCHCCCSCLFAYHQGQIAGKLCQNAFGWNAANSVIYILEHMIIVDQVKKSPSRNIGSFQRSGNFLFGFAPSQYLNCLQK